MADKKEKKTFKAYEPGKQCAKCGARMARHSDRLTCGRCGYTEFVKSESQQQQGKQKK
ncbi:MAG: 30S ribosomal protein S27ae [Candidatus Micrarchaeota archaeon]|nr:30S ribosomal protein S27ae [Candidatus Micrarchaeota archaeon]